MDAVYKLAMSKPYVESIAWGNLADMSHTVPAGGLLDDMLKPRPRSQAPGDCAKLPQVAREQAAEAAYMIRWRLPEVWTASQRGVLLALLAADSSTCHPPDSSTRLRERSAPARPPRYDELADRIDPNTADWQSLAALPALGEKRAKTIIEYREAFTKQHPDHLAFEEPETYCSCAASVPPCSRRCDPTCCSRPMQRPDRRPVQRRSQRKCAKRTKRTQFTVFPLVPIHWQRLTRPRRAELIGTA
jgi:DNA uptake protein ComE-like DNA-binding protein